jgi:hypothetical protein
MAGGDIIGEATDHDSLVALLRQRKAALQLSDQLVDELGGLAQGHTGKLLGAAPVKTLGAVSLSALLAVFGLKLVVVVDEMQTARIGHRWQRKAVTRDHPASYTIAAARPLVLARAARKAALARWKGTTPEDRAAVGAMLVVARKTKRARTCEAA